MGAATILQADGELMIDDPVAAAMLIGLAKHNCVLTLKAHEDRVSHFVDRVAELKMPPAAVVVTLIRVDDVHGGPLADALMPGTDWDELRMMGQIPYARGLAGREGVQEYIESFDVEAGKKLRTIVGVAIVVVDHGVAEVFEVAS